MKDKGVVNKTRDLLFADGAPPSPRAQSSPSLIVNKERVFENKENAALKTQLLKGKKRKLEEDFKQQTIKIMKYSSRLNKPSIENN